MAFIDRSRRITIRNTSGSVLTVKGKRLQISEEYTLATDEITRFANDENFIGLVGSGTLQIIDTDSGAPFITTVTGVIDFITARDGIKTITVQTSTEDPDVTISGLNVTLSGVGGIALSTIDEEDAIITTVSGEPLPTTSGQVIDEDLITINRARFGYGKNGKANGTYLRVEGAASSQTGHVMVRPARLTGIAAFYPGGNSEKRFEIRKNGDPTAFLEAVVQKGVPFIKDELIVDFDAGDRIQVFVTSSGNFIRDPNFWVEIGWRAV